MRYAGRSGRDPGKDRFRKADARAVDLRILVEHGGQLPWKSQEMAYEQFGTPIAHMFSIRGKEPLKREDSERRMFGLWDVDAPGKRCDPPPDGFPRRSRLLLEGRPHEGAILEASVWPLGAEGHLPGRGDGPMAFPGSRRPVCTRVQFLLSDLPVFRLRLALPGRPA